jgi:hypothetical protein
MKRKTHPLFSALLGSALIATTSLAQDGERPRPPGGPEGRGNPAEMLKRADTDGDGKVSKAEFIKSRTAELEEAFGRIDANGDGFIDEVEVKEIAERMRAGMGREGPGAPPEGMRRPPEGEGRGGPEGMRRPEGEGRGGPEGMRRPEGEGRGGPEGMRRPEGGAAAIMGDQAFARMDQNGDGQLSKEEFEQGMARMREMMGRGGMGRGEGRGPGAPGGPGAEGGFRRPPAPEGEGKGRPRPELEGDAPKKDA